MKPVMKLSEQHDDTLKVYDIYIYIFFKLKFMEQPEAKTVETASENDGQVDFDEPTLKGENSYKSVDNLLDY